MYCDWCGEKRELVRIGKAWVCKFCRHKHLTKSSHPNSIEVRARRDDFESKQMSERTYANYARNTSKSLKLGSSEK